MVNSGTGTKTPYSWLCIAMHNPVGSWGWKLIFARTSIDTESDALQHKQVWAPSAQSSLGPQSALLWTGVYLLGQTVQWVDQANCFQKYALLKLYSENAPPEIQPTVLIFTESHATGLHYSLQITSKSPSNTFIRAAQILGFEKKLPKKHVLEWFDSARKLVRFTHLLSFNTHDKYLMTQRTSVSGGLCCI